MSASIVRKAHITAMIRAALAHRQDFSWYHQGNYQRLAGSDLDKVGQMLLDQCVASVRYRYRDGEDSDDLPGPVNNEWRRPYSFNPLGRVPTALEALKLIRCYDYQSCENPEWEQSEAKTFCDALFVCLVSVLPGYEEAAWEWREKV